jgi:hypothetical protein
MEIIERKGFRIVLEDKDNQYVLITDENLMSAGKFMLEHGYRKIQLNYTAGFSQESTEFLKDYEFVDGIVIMPPYNMDISGIHYLKKLKKIAVSRDMKHPIRFEEFPLLEYCGVSWHVKNTGLETCVNLKHLAIDKYKNKDFTSLVSLIHLTHLEIITSGIQNFTGIEQLKRLKYLGLFYCPKLESLSLVPDTLTTLNLQSCKRIDKVDQLAKVINLEKLHLNNCMDLESLQPIKQLRRLKLLEFWGNTNILDGDIAPCIGIESVVFDNRKHYNYTYEQIKEINLALVR